MSSLKTQAPSSKHTVVEPEDFDYTDATPDFIYGGPFITYPTKAPFINSITPINIALSGTFKMSFAYESLKERLPVILTKLIDYLSREQSSVTSESKASASDVQELIKFIAKLKNDLVTNKPYDLFTVDTPEANKWNEWIHSSIQKTYFNNTWLFTECYVYRKLKEGCELHGHLKDFDYFAKQKKSSFQDNIGVMCVVADKMIDMLPASAKDKRKADFVTLLKICLWSNKCDLSLSLGSKVQLVPSEKNEHGDDAHKDFVVDPFQMILDMKDKLLVDDSGKIADQVVNKSEAMAKNLDNPGQPMPEPPRKPEKGKKGKKGKKAKEVKAQPAETQMKENEPEPEKLPEIPCPAKMVAPSAVTFDIVCDNAGYELFADICLAHFLISQKIVQRIRFHLKKYPWFVSDATPQDFHYVIESCKNANFRSEGVRKPKVTIQGEEPVEQTKPVSSDNLRKLGEQWSQLLESGEFVLMTEDYWTYPHSYKDMKKYDFYMYRRLQYCVAIMFKGDLNYRKLLGERNCVPTQPLEPALQGFIPAPIIALRTVKSELICGLPKGKYEQINKIDPKWMRTGNFGVIQFCPKAEPLKVLDRPCAHYVAGDECYGIVCPEHTGI